MPTRTICLAAQVALFVATGVAAQGVPLTMPVDSETRNISVVTDRGLTSTNQLPTTELRAARRAMNSDVRLGNDDLRALADRGDGMAAWRYAKRLRAMGAEASASDIAHYAAIAVGQGRVYGLDDMIAGMRRIEPGSEPAARLNQLIKVLYAHAWAGNALALDAVIEFNGEGRLFGALSDATRDRILAQARTMDGRVELRFALDLMGKPALSKADEAAARGYLQRAKNSKNLAVMTTAQNLIGLLDAKAVQAGAAKQ